jgi:hypothetical protein
MDLLFIGAMLSLAGLTALLVALCDRLAATSKDRR